MNGLDALNIFRKKRFDVVVTDIKMPKMNGMDLLKNIRDMKSDTHVIIITGHANERHESMARHIGVDGFFSKPLDVHRFMDTLMDIETEIGCTGKQ